jgi:hypothetical protein
VFKIEIISPSTQHPVLGSRESRYNVWQATTTSLLLEKRDSLCKGDEVVGKTKAALSGLLEDINEVLLHIRPSHGSGYKKQLLQILVDAADLDLEISRQVASISWHFSLDGQDDARQMYDPRFMELDVGENAPSGGREHEVKIVLAPAMVKRGKSTGEAKSFEERPQWLTKMKASLVSL